MPSAADHRLWLESLSPWPEEFGLARMRQLLRAVGDPQRAFPAVHVVGSNGKTTTTRLAEALLAGEGLAVGAYTSPHVLGWSERIRVRVNGSAEGERERLRKEIARAEGMLGNDRFVANAPPDVVEGEREKLAVLAPGATAVLGEPEWEESARDAGAAAVVVAGYSNLALALAAVESFLGRTVDPAAAEEVSLPGRVERISEEPVEIWDGAHNLAGVGWLLARLPARRYVLVVSILADKDADGMLAALSALGDRVVVTASTNERALAPEVLAAHAQRFFADVDVVAEPGEAVLAARDAAGPAGAVLVTGSLYLLADLAAFRPVTAVPWPQ